MYSAHSIVAGMDYNHKIGGVTKNSREVHHSSFHNAYFYPSLVHPHSWLFHYPTTQTTHKYS